MIGIYNVHRSRQAEEFRIQLLIFSYPSFLICVLGTQKNCLIETVLLSTHIICFASEIRKNSFQIFKFSYLEACSPIWRPDVLYFLQLSLYSTGYLYAGVQYHHECWCGISYGKHGSLPETSCKMTCPGNNSEICGGYNAQRVFSTGLPRKFNSDSGLLIIFANSLDQNRTR